MSLSHFLKYQFPLILWIVLIFALSAIPRIPAIKLPLSPDKLAHAGIYFVLCMFCTRALVHQEWSRWMQRNALIVALAFTVLYGILDEVHQLYVPGRTADIYDVLADSMGGLFFAAWHRWRRPTDAKDDEGN